MSKTGAGRILIAAVTAVVANGCGSDNTPPPPRAAIPPVGTYTVTTDSPTKPLPPTDPTLANRPPYADEPLLSQQPPEQGAFVATYERVGRPRMMLFVNRTLGGQIVQTNPGGPVSGVQRTREATGAVKAESSGAVIDAWGRTIAQPSDRFETTGPAELRDRTEHYLAPGEYDEASARRIDYDAIESVLSDWMAAGGRVALVSPRLTEGQARRLEQGGREALTDLSTNNQADVLIQVQARPTKQTPQGLSIRLIAEAMNTRGGESLARAVIDVPPPLDKPVLNEYTRFLARKLMNDMTQTWSAPRPPADTQRQGQGPGEASTSGPLQPPATQPNP
ncbi:MAG TPA: hypothetical protein VF595_11930 [Tepidisphaeraceae bacterium]